VGDRRRRRQRCWKSSDAAHHGYHERATGSTCICPNQRYGKIDAAYGIFPDLDLTPDGGLAGGVSRRHARILRKDNRLTVEDLGSTNGTFLNGQRLTPYLSYALQKGDKLQLGSVRLCAEHS
jgi:hypothetical protein